MRLWRLYREPFAALDGSGPVLHGARWTSPGRPVVNCASEAALAVLVVLRYLPRDLVGIDSDYRLGHIDLDVQPERLPFVVDQAEKRRIGDDWLISRRSLLAAVQSAVLPEADIVMLNPLHPDALGLPEITSRRFDFARCLALPDAP